MEEVVIYIVMGVIYTIYSVYKNRSGKKPKNTSTPPIFTEDKRTSQKPKHARTEQQPVPVSDKRKQPTSIEEFLEGYLEDIEKGQKKQQQTQHENTADAKQLEADRKKSREKSLRREKENRAKKQQEAYQRKLEADRRRQTELIAAKSAAQEASLEVIDVEKYHEMKHDKMQADYISNSDITQSKSDDFMGEFEFNARDAVIYDVIFRRKYE